MFVLSSKNISTSKERMQNEQIISAQQDSMITAIENDTDTMKIVIRSIESQNEEILHYQREQATQESLTMKELEKIREDIRTVKMQKK